MASPLLSNSILDDLEKSSLLLISLMGVRTLLERELRLKDMLLTSEDSALAELKRRLTDPLTFAIAYPYGYLSLSELSAVKDHTPNKNVRRHGLRMGTAGATRATARKGYVFPILVQLSLHYLDNDPVRTFRMAEALIILGQIGPLTFSMKLGEGMELEVQVEIPDSASIPISESENTHAPDAQEIEVPLIIHTWAGFCRDVSSVNSDRPTEITIELEDNYLPTGD
jgi:hypothetical protein